MWICKRKPGEAIELEHLGYVNKVRLIKVIDGKHAWIAINGETYGPLSAGTEIVMGGQTAILLTIVRSKGQEVAIGIKAPREVKLRAAQGHDD